MSGIKGKSGGARENSGRHQRYGEPTVPMRVPISLVPDLEKKMKKLEEKAAKKKK